MIGRGVREHYRARCDCTKPMKPIRPANDHEAGAFLANEQSAVPPVSARNDLNLAARAKEGQLHGGVVDSILIASQSSCVPTGMSHKGVSFPVQM